MYGRKYFYFNPFLKLLNQVIYYCELKTDSQEMQTILFVIMAMIKKVSKMVINKRISREV